jgi:hypothetical protein
MATIKYVLNHFSLVLANLGSFTLSDGHPTGTYKHGDPSVEVRRLHEENSTLHAQVATTAREKSKITWECEALLRKLNLNGPAVCSFPAFFYDV